MTGTVGIVVPAHEAGRFLAATLRSIEEQTLTDWVCVVIDDGSTDDTRAIATGFAERDARFRVRHEAQAGPCAARNLGLHELREQVEYLTFMDADDLWLPGTLQVLVTAARSDADAIGAHGLADFVDETGAPMLPGTFRAIGRARLGCRGGWPRPCGPADPTGFEQVVTQSVLFPPGVMIASAAAYRAAGEFDESVRFAEDWDMVVRLTRLGHLAFVDDVVLWYRRHEHNLGSSKQVPRAAANVRRKTFASPENSAEQRRIVRDAWRAAQVIDARNRLRAARAAWAGRRWSEGVAEVGRLPFLGARYVRGAPARPSS